MRKRFRPGFTLIELLIVMGIVALMAAILFPVFATVRAKARQSVCASNLRQISIAIMLYSQDNDTLFPYGVDASDKYGDAWQSADGGTYWPGVTHLPLLPEIMFPYTSSKSIWQCPSDVGLDSGAAYTYGIPRTPSCYDTYGISYFYHTKLALKHETIGGLVAYSLNPPYTEYGPSEIDILHDAVGKWHGGEDYMTARYNMLMGDGHVSNVSEERHQELLNVTLDRPTAP